VPALEQDTGTTNNTQERAWGTD